jgi:hypothetical protein
MSQKGTKMKNAKPILAIVSALLAFAPAAFATNTINPGQTLTGSIGSPGKSVAYEFTANANDVFDFTVATNGLPPEIQILDSSDDQIAIAVAASCNTNTVELNSLQVKTAGTYYAIVSACNNTSTGTFELYMQSTNNPGGATGISFGQTTPGTISSSAQSNSYTFTASKNDVIYFEMATNSLPPRIRLYGTGPSQIAEASASSCNTNTVEMTATIPADGTYTVLTAACDDLGTGKTQLYFQRVNDPGGSVDLVPGESQTGSIATSAQNNAYSFAGSSGDGISFTVSTNGFPPRIRVYNSSGTKLVDDSAASCNTNTLETATLHITAAGSYSVLVGACNDVSPGNYTISSQCIGTCLVPAPIITSISPSSAEVGSGGLTLTVNGANFAEAETQSYVEWNGAKLNTTFVNTGQLTAVVPPADTAVSGLFPVTVVTPSNGGGTSNTEEFTVYNPAPGASIGISPPSAQVGSSAVTLTVTGSSFVSNSSVMWSGSALATTYVSATELTATIPAADLVSASPCANVTVVNPAVVNGQPAGGGQTNPQCFSVYNPKPNPTGISPQSVTAGTGAVTLTVNGSGFVNSSTVQLTNSGLATTFVSSAQLTATIPATATACGATDTIGVSNPTPGGGTAGALTFTVNNPVPAMSTISPQNAAAGGAQFTLTVNGSNFIPCAVVEWNGSPLSTKFVSASQLTATVPATDIANPGTANVTVLNELSGGGITGGTPSSSSQPFTIGNFPVPTLTSIQPSSATAGGAGFTLTANGTNFVQGSTVNWGSSALVTTFVSSTKLTAAVPASDIASAGNFNVTVVNPGPGGGPSSPQTFTVNNPVPVVTSISPTSAAAQGPAFTLCVNGSNFVQGTTPAQGTSILWGAASLPTNYVSSVKVCATVPATDIATPGTVPVTASNPAPGGGTAPTTQPFTITNPPAPTPVITPAAGSYGSGVMISISDTPGLSIYYTTNGTTPTPGVAGTTLYSKPFLIDSSVTITAIATGAGFTPSSPASSAFTIGGSPTALTLPAASVTATQATLRSIVHDEGLAAQAWFVWGTSNPPTSTTPTQALSASVGSQAVNAVVKGLQANTTYYFQVVVSSAGGTSSSAILTFTTP